jgi:hypothetical protein
MDAPGHRHRFQFCPVEMPLGLIVADAPRSISPFNVSLIIVRTCPQFTYRAVSWA